MAALDKQSSRVEQHSPHGGASEHLSGARAEIEASRRAQSMQAAASDAARGDQRTQAAAAASSETGRALDSSAAHLEMTNPYEKSSNQKSVVAQNSGEQSGNQNSDSGTSWSIRQNYSERFPSGQVFSPSEAGGIDKLQSAKPGSAGSGSSENSGMGPGAVSHDVSGPQQMWPANAGPSQSTFESKYVGNKASSASDSTGKWNGAKGDSGKGANKENPYDQGIYGRTNWHPQDVLAGKPEHS
jgi:hypothetical protein